MLVVMYLQSAAVFFFTHADDILLLSPTVTGLQILLSACENELVDLDMRINVKKSFCIRFGPRYYAHCSELVSLQPMFVQ